jgi:undecaprenyl-diphosphatase
MDNVNGRQSILIGIFQCLSLWPGMSRSASTIMGGWIAGLSNEAAAEFSFFLAIPTMIAASGFDLFKSRHEIANLNSLYVIALGLGFVVAFIVALLVVEKFINFLKRKPMRVFGVYRIIIGAFLLILAFTKVIAL